MCAGVAADRGFTWSDDETALLLQLWGANDAQSELTGNKRNFVVYEKISETMSNMGYVRTASQCREKIKRMKREYTLTKQHNDRSNGPKKSMRFYEQFEKILLEKQSRNQKNTTLKSCPSSSGLESEIDETENSVKRNWERSTRKVRNVAPKPEQPTRKRFETVEKEAGNPWTPDVVLVEGEETPSSTLFENQSSASASSVNGDLSQKKKRKLASRMSAFKCMMDTLTLKFMKHQTESDARILSKIEQIENERNSMDERIHKMWLDFEEKRRADDREHELNVMAAFQDIVNQIKVNHMTQK